MDGTSSDSFKWVEKGHKQIHQDSQVEWNAAPERHVAGTPIQNGLGCGNKDRAPWGSRLQARTLGIHTALPLRPYKSTFVPSFYHNSKNDCLFWRWLIGSERHQIGLFLFGVLTGTEDVLGAKEEKKGEKLEHLKTLHAPVNTISYGILGVIQGSCAESSVLPGVLGLDEMPKETRKFNETLRSGGHWLVGDTQHSELAQLGPRLGTMLPLPHSSLARNSSPTHWWLKAR